MIGIKVQNSVWEKALLDLLKENAEIWEKTKSYQAVIVQIPSHQIKDFQRKEKAPLIFLGKKNQKNFFLPIPFTFVCVNVPS